MSESALHSAQVTARVYEERRRQCAPEGEGGRGEGFTIAHDDEHTRGEIAAASACYAEHAFEQISRGAAGAGGAGPPAKWPWSPRWWKPSPDPARNLEKSAALAVAEIERIERAKARGNG
jgi:hypothetical protein